MIEEYPIVFEVDSFVQNLFQDLSLTLPSLGCHFKGIVTPSDVSARADAGRLKNKLFLFFADLAATEKEMSFKFVLTASGPALKLCFVALTALPALADPSKLPNWDPVLFKPFTAPTGGSGFCLEVDFGPEAASAAPPFDKAGLYAALEDRDAAWDLATAFRQRAETLLLELQSALQGQNIGETLRLAHTLKGAAWSIFAVPLAKKAHLLEMTARNNTLEGAADLYKAIQVAYDEFKVFFARESR